MAVVTLVVSCLLGFMAAVFHVGFGGGTFSQGFITYLFVSVSAFAATGLSSWVVAKVSRMGQGASKTPEEELEEWRDWQFQEDIADAAARGAEMESLPEDFVAPKRNSA